MTFRAILAAQYRCDSKYNQWIFTDHGCDAKKLPHLNIYGLLVRKCTAEMLSRSKQSDLSLCLVVGGFIYAVKNTFCETQTLKLAQIGADRVFS